MSGLATAVGIAEQWLYQTLSGDGTLAGLVAGRIYSTVAPEGAIYPMVVFASLGAVDTNQLGPFRTLTQALYAVKAIDASGSIAGLDAIQARIDRLLQGRTNVILDGGYMLGCRRERQMVLGDATAGVMYRQLISTYRLYVQEGH